MELCYLQFSILYLFTGSTSEEALLMHLSLVVLKSFDSRSAFFFQNCFAVVLWVIYQESKSS